MTNQERLDWIDRNGGFAFPGSLAMPEGGTFETAGMSLRDWFAGKSGMPLDGISTTWAEAVMGEKAPDWMLDNNLDCVRWWATAEARARYIIADAMLAERAKAVAP